MQISDQGELVELKKNYPAAVKIPAVILSYLLHPVLIVAWTTLYLLFVNQDIFLGMETGDKIIVFLRIFSTSVFLPTITVLLLKALGFISSVTLQSQRERIIPLVAWFGIRWPVAAGWHQ